MRRKNKANPDAMGEGVGPPEPRRLTSQNGTAQERIRQRAYELFLQRAANGTPGDGISDWLEAERQLAQEQAGRNALHEAAAG